MAVHRCSTMTGAAALLIALAALGGCDKKAEPAAAATATPVAAAPDPAAPAPGTQAAEAIGADSASDGPMVPPEKQVH